MRKEQKVVHLFDDGPIYAIKEVVSVQDEEDLAQFWEYILKTQSSQSTLYTFFASLYELCVQFLDSSETKFFEIIVEQSDEAYYFTVWSKEFVKFSEPEIIKRHILFTSNSKRLSMKILKSLLEEKKIEQSVYEEKRVGKLISTAAEGTSKISPQVHRLLSQDDLDELMNLSDDMNEHIFQLRNSGVALETLIRLRSTLSMISIVMNHYEEIQTVAVIMTEFSVMLSQYKEEILDLAGDQISLLEGFAHNFERWLKVLFVYGGAELNFMDRSLRADIELIRQMIVPSTDDVSDEDLDAIFDF